MGEIEFNLEGTNQYDSDESLMDDIDDVNAFDDQAFLLYHEVWDDTQQGEIDE